MKRKGAVADWFWEKVQRVDDESSCWLWSGGVNSHGYGIFGGKSEGAHCVSYRIAFGPIPKGMKVCHTCDVRNCVRPTHFFLGTTRDNALDAKAKGRLAHGERHGTARITRADVFEITRRRLAGESVRQVITALSLNKHTVRSVYYQAHWKLEIAEVEEELKRGLRTVI